MPKTVGEKIQSFREEAEISRLELGNAVGVTRTCVYQWETDKHTPGLRRFPLIAKALGVSPDRLMPSGSTE